MGIDKNAEVASAGIASLRSFRSRRSRPCDRCRSRKQRCVILNEGNKCLNCELSAADCLFNLPPMPNPNNAARSIKRQQQQQQLGQEPQSGKHKQPLQHAQPQAGSSTSAQSGTKGSAQRPHKKPGPQQSGTGSGHVTPTLPYPLVIPPTLAQQQQQQHHMGGGYFANAAGPISPFGPAEPSHFVPPSLVNTPLQHPQPARPPMADIVHAIAQANTNHTYASSLQAAAEEYPALDLQADEEEELYLVGTAAERDALRLSLSAGVTNQYGRGALKVRHVSRDSNAPVAFMFMSAKPYDEAPANASAYDELVAVVGADKIDKLLGDYLRIDAVALPIWSQEHYAAQSHLNVGLRCSYITAAMAYTPELRHLQHRAWGVTRAYFRLREPRARLHTIQATLIDLNGRHGVDPAGNFVRLGATVAIARLLGLHKDSSTWTIPLWERDLRARLWWALVVYDKVSALTFGRPSVIGTEDHVSLPRRSPQDSPSYSAFVSLCELTLIMDELNRRLRTSLAQTVAEVEFGEGHAINHALEVLGDMSLKLDRWKALCDARMLFQYRPDEAPPGIRSLQLAYLYTALVITRESWDALPRHSGQATMLGQQSCLLAATEFVDFIVSLTVKELEGYWASHSPFFISTCLTILVRLTLESDKSDHSDQAVWQAAVFNLRRLVNALSDARRDAAWDIADLALSRAQFFIPLLSRRAPEFSVVLQPLTSAFPSPPVDDALDDFVNAFVAENYSHLPFGTSSSGFDSAGILSPTGSAEALHNNPGQHVTSELDTFDPFAMANFGHV
ncbi:hypothetical protein OIV83_001875 [Microbotryomycetes sp. JL201]|nr:hypothetical protein OIV83_001875 [Microbotryomycetes sp. JL201]